MLKCPNCNTIYYDESLKRCLKCKYELVKDFDNDTDYNELKSWSYTLMMVLGVIGIALGICCMTIVKSAWQETSALLIIILGTIVALFGKHLKEQRKILNILRDHMIHMVRIDMRRKIHINDETSDMLDNAKIEKSLSSYTDIGKKSVPDKGWKCPSCGYSNHSSQSICQRCFTTKKVNWRS